MSLRNDKYEVIFEKDSEDLDSRAYLLRHKKSGARVFILSNDDDNKVFYIGFRTPPADSTGVPHILEHSTLCGSAKFPLKDPFVELAKGSLNTFLNAMTYPDKTVYPVASCNDTDFRNLMDVYMDAVFHPNVYKYPEILKQEGWSYHIEDPEDPIEYNGVVYNEMKGAFSSPEDVLMRETMNSLFPDTAYGVESGGDPDHIPELTYEEFIDFHRRYYHPSNSYIYLYGDIDIEERLEWMDREYLSEHEQIQVRSDIELQKAFTCMQDIEKEYPITDDEDERDNTYLSYNLVCGSVMDIKKVVAMQILTYALIDTQGAPVRQRLLDEGIGKDILCSYDDGVLQPYIQIISKNANKEQKDDFIRIINEEFMKARTEGINKKSLLAGLNSLEFKYREADYGGFPKGLAYGLNALSSWLYDDSQPLLHIELGDIFSSLRDSIDTGYYEDLIDECLLDNPHSSLVTLVPRKGLAKEKEEKIAKKLAAYKASLSEEELQKLIEETKALDEYQKEPSSKEDLETIPLLSRDDIKKESRKPSNIEEKVGDIPFIRHDHPTCGIAYISMIFDCNDIPKRLFPYLGLLKSVISFVDTEHYSFSVLNDEINIATGGFGWDTGIYNSYTDLNRISVLGDLSVRTLYKNTGKAFDLIEEVLLTGKYDDKKRLYEIIAELKSKLQMSLMSAGHAASSLRAGSYFSESMALKEEINGIKFYKFVEDLEKNFEDRFEDLKNALNEIIRMIIRPDCLIVSCTCTPDGADIVKERVAEFADRLKGSADISGTSEKTADFRDRHYDFYGKGFVLEKKNEAFRTSGSVNYLARAGKFADSSDEFTGSIAVFQTIMRYDYLWFNIRVQGGAYGCMCNANAAGNMNFVTYRDPNISRSNEVFEGICDYLENFDCDEREMTKYVIGTMSNVDMPVTPSIRGMRDMSGYLTCEDHAGKQRVRNEMISCTCEDIRKLAPLIRRVLEGGNICCVGGESKINEDSALFNSITNLFE